MVETLLAVKPLATNAESQAPGYNPALDGLRGVAIALVLLFHAQVPGFGAGFLGVDVFFVLSGFLITSLLLSEIDRTGSINWRRFVLRRIYRLAPALAGLCLGMLLLSIWFWPAPTSPAVEVLLAMAYLSDVSVAFLNNPQMLGHSWSLSVEEHFYLIWPLVLLLVCRADRCWILAFLCAFYILATAWRIELVRSGIDWWQVYFRLDARLSGLMFGGLLAGLVWSFPGGRWWHLHLWIACLPIALFVLSIGEWRDERMLVFGIPLIEATTATVILSCLSGRGVLFFLLSVLPMRWLGKLSYSLYLWHYPIFRILRDQVDWPQSLAMGLPLSVAFAWLSYRTVERWGLTKRELHFRQG